MSRNHCVKRFTLDYRPLVVKIRGSLSRAADNYNKVKGTGDRPCLSETKRT